MSCGAAVDGVGAGETLEESCGVVAAGEAAGELPVVGGAAGGVSSWADEIEQMLINKMQMKASRALIRIKV